MSCCYRKSEISYAASTWASGASARLGELGLGGSDEGLKLLSTVAGCYQERGRFGPRAVDGGPGDGASREAGYPAGARGSYSNASLMVEESGRLGEALTLAERALGLYGEGEDRRSLRGCERPYAWLLLRQDRRRPTS